jgi:hypothetical protein
MKYSKTKQKVHKIQENIEKITAEKQPTTQSNCTSGGEVDGGDQVERVGGSRIGWRQREAREPLRKVDRRVWIAKGATARAEGDRLGSTVALEWLWTVEGEVERQWY